MKQIFQTVLVLIFPLFLNAQNFCLAVPKFVGKLGFNVNDYALTTSNKHARGLSMLSLKDESYNKTPYQHESWDDAGHLGHIVRDHIGNCFLIPIPSVNVLYNPIEKQNDIYRVDSKTGILKYFMTIPNEHKPSSQNPFGMLGLTYDCEFQCLYGASVMGSDRKNERGIITQIDIKTKKIISTYSGLDAMGLYTVKLRDKKYLLVGAARSSDIYAIELDAKGSFLGKAVKVISIEGLGPRGDDIARRISMDRKGNLKISGISFYFNLAAPSEKSQSHYTFKYDLKSNSFQFLGWR